MFLTTASDTVRYVRHTLLCVAGMSLHTGHTFLRAEE